MVIVENRVERKCLIPWNTWVPIGTILNSIYIAPLCRKIQRTDPSVTEKEPDPSSRVRFKLSCYFLLIHSLVDGDKIFVGEMDSSCFRMKYSNCSPLLLCATPSASTRTVCSIILISISLRHPMKKHWSRLAKGYLPSQWFQGKIG